MSDYSNIQQIYITLRTAMARLVSKVVPPKEVEDIVQETYVRICQMDEKEEIRHPRSFIMTTARNLALDHIKRSESRLCDTFDSVESQTFLETPHLDYDEDETFNRVAAKEEFANFCEAVRELPQKCRRAFVLKKVYGYSQKEIALTMKISESTVEKHIANGIRLCADFMQNNSQSILVNNRRRKVMGGDQ